MKKKSQIKIIQPEFDTTTDIPLSDTGVSAGFPSPAEDHTEETLDLNKYLVRHPSATFYVRVQGESMKDDCINDGDLLVVDRSVKPYNGCVAVCFLNGEFTLKRLLVEKDTITLMPANKRYKPIVLHKGDELTVWVIVTYCIQKI